MLSNRLIRLSSRTEQIVNADINQSTLNQSNTSHVKQVSQGNSSKTATVDDQATSLPKQTQCNSSKSATADDQVIPLPKQMDQPKTSLPMQKKDKPCPFIVRHGWFIKGQECDFSHGNLVNNLDLRKLLMTRKARGQKPSSFFGEPATDLQFMETHTIPKTTNGNLSTSPPTIPISNNVAATRTPLVNHVNIPIQRPIYNRYHRTLDHLSPF